MYAFKEFKLSNIIIIEFYYLLISIKRTFAGELVNIKKLTLSDSSYFVILDTGLYLYNLTCLKLFIIHKFNNNEFRESNNNRINLTELYDGYKAYIFCLVNEYLFVFNEYTNDIYNYKINEIETFNSYYYNIMPYKMENTNISFIIKLYFNNSEYR